MQLEVAQPPYSSPPPGSCVQAAAWELGLGRSSSNESAASSCTATGQLWARSKLLGLWAKSGSAGQIWPEDYIAELCLTLFGVCCFSLSCWIASALILWSHISLLCLKSVANTCNVTAILWVLLYLTLFLKPWTLESHEYFKFMDTVCKTDFLAVGGYGNNAGELSPRLKIFFLANEFSFYFMSLR